MARGRYVVLMNDDLWVRPDFLLETNAPSGRRRFPPPCSVTWSSPSRWTRRRSSSWYQPFAYHELVGRAGVPLEWLYFWSMNISVPRSELVGRNLMFHEDWAEIGSEDVELGWRWAQAGNQIVYDPNAWGEHYHPHTLASVCRLQESVGRGLRHPRGARRRRAPPAALRDPLHPQRTPRRCPPTSPDRPVQPVDRPRRPALARLALRQQRPQPVDVLEGAALLHDPRVLAGASPSPRAGPRRWSERRMSAVVIASAAPGRRIPRLRRSSPHLRRRHRRCRACRGWPPRRGSRPWSPSSPSSASSACSCSCRTAPPSSRWASSSRSSSSSTRSSAISSSTPRAGRTAWPSARPT